MNEIKIIDHRPYTIRRVFSKLCMIISRSAMFPSSVRTRILKLGGIKISGWCFVGAGVHFDEMRPDLIEIGEGSTITGGSHIISHFYGMLWMNLCLMRYIALVIILMNMMRI